MLQIELRNVEARVTRAILSYRIVFNYIQTLS